MSFCKNRFRDPVNLVRANVSSWCKNISSKCETSLVWRELELTTRFEWWSRLGFEFAKGIGVFHAVCVMNALQTRPHPSQCTLLAGRTLRSEAVSSAKRVSPCFCFFFWGGGIVHRKWIFETDCSVQCCLFYKTPVAAVVLQRCGDSLKNPKHWLPDTMVCNLSVSRESRAWATFVHVRFGGRWQGLGIFAWHMFCHIPILRYFGFACLSSGAQLDITTILIVWHSVETRTERLKPQLLSRSSFCSLNEKSFWTLTADAMWWETFSFLLRVAKSLLFSLDMFGARKLRWMSTQTVETVESPWSAFHTFPPLAWCRQARLSSRTMVFAVTNEEEPFAGWLHTLWFCSEPITPITDLVFVLLFIQSTTKSLVWRIPEEGVEDLRAFFVRFSISDVVNFSACHFSDSMINRIWASIYSRKGNCIRICNTLRYVNVIPSWKRKSELPSSQVHLTSKVAGKRTWAASEKYLWYIEACNVLPWLYNPHKLVNSRIGDVQAAALHSNRYISRQSLRAFFYSCQFSVSACDDLEKLVLWCVLPVYTYLGKKAKQKEHF